MTQEPMDEDRTPWIKIRVSMPKSDKISALRKELGLHSRHEAVGLIIDLLVNTYINAWKDGDLSKWDAVDVEEWLGWKGEDGVMVAALQKVGVLDGMKVHNWVKHQRRTIYNRTYQESVRHGGRPSYGKPQIDEDPNAMRKRTRAVLKDD